MIGSPENNFNTMQNQQPSPQKYGNALQKYKPTNNLGKLSNLPSDGFPLVDHNFPNFGPGSGMPPGGNPIGQVRINPPASGFTLTDQNIRDFSGPGQVMSPKSLYNLQPQMPNMQAQGPMGIGQTQGQNRYGVGLAKQQNTQAY